MKTKLQQNAKLSEIWTLAWPTMLEQLMQTAVQYIDLAMVGALGTAATAAVGATGTLNWLISGTISALGVGFLAGISQSLGAGKNDHARRISAQAVTVSLFVGVIVTILTVGLSPYIPAWMQVDTDIREAAGRYFMILYIPTLFRTFGILHGTVLRAAGDTKTPMRVGITVNIINIILNFFLIYPTRSFYGVTMPGAGLGIDGAAVASAIAYTYGGVAIAVRLWKHDVISPRKRRLLPDWEVLCPCFRIAVPNMAQRFITLFGYVAFSTMINGIGETAMAAHTIANTVEGAFYIPGWGMQTAAATLAGNAWGRQDEKAIRDLTKTVLVLEMGLMVVSGGLLFWFAPSLMAIFSKDATVIALGTQVLRMVAISEPFYGVPIVLEGMMQGMGKTVAPFIYNVIGMWGIRNAGTFILTRYFAGTLVGAWGCMIAHNIMLFFAFTLHFWVIQTKQKNIEEDTVCHFVLLPIRRLMCRKR